MSTLPYQGGQTAPQYVAALAQQAQRPLSYSEFMDLRGYHGEEATRHAVFDLYKKGVLRRVARGMYVWAGKPIPDGRKTESQIIQYAIAIALSKKAGATLSEIKALSKLPNDRRVIRENLMRLIAQGKVSRSLDEESPFRRYQYFLAGVE